MNSDQTLKNLKEEAAQMEPKLFSIVENMKYMLKMFEDEENYEACALLITYDQKIYQLLNAFCKLKNS